MTPYATQTCQHELTGWKRKTNIYPQHFRDLLHCHYCRDLSGPVTHFTFSSSVTQIIFSQETRNTSELPKCEGKKAKGEREKGSARVSPANICFKNGSNKYNEDQTAADGCSGMLRDAQGRRRVAGYLGHRKRPHSPAWPAAPEPPQPGPARSPGSVPEPPQPSLARSPVSVPQPRLCPAAPCSPGGQGAQPEGAGADGCRNAASAGRRSCQPPEHFPAREQIRGKR